MILLVVKIFDCLLTVLLLCYFFGKALPRRRFGNVAHMAVNILYVALFSVITVWLLDNDWGPLFHFLGVIGFVLTKYKTRFIKCLLLSVLYYSLAAFADVLIVIIQMYVLSVDVHTVRENVVLYLYVVILSKLLLYGILRLVGSFRLTASDRLDPKTVTAAIGITVLVAAVTVYLTVISYDVQGGLATFHVITLLIMLAFAVVLTFYLLEKQKNIYETQTYMKNMASQYALQAAYYAELKNNLIATNKNTHDIKNFAAALSAYLEAGKTAEAKERLDEFIDKIPAAASLDTGNMAINALLHAKSAGLQKIGKRSLSIALPPELAIDEIDLCVLIGNAIDNALEACSQIENEEERYINIKIFPFNNCLSLLFENACTEKAAADLFATAKPQAFLHGFGLENMRALCAKYNGDISCEQTGGHFSLSILLPN
jgi:hypothetical protein